MKKEKIYVFVSLPMYGKTEEEIKEEYKRGLDFAKELVSGIEVELLDTYFTEEPDLSEIPDSKNERFTRAFYLSKSIKLLGKADIMIRMPGWENAPGCVVENEVCKNYGIFAYDYPIDEIA